jgi:hypothetical protein
MATRYEHAAGLIESHVTAWGDNGGDYNTIIGILRDCHDIEAESGRFEDLAAAIVERVNRVYGPEPLDFDKMTAAEDAADNG